MAKAGIMGAGSWGTALALLLYKNGHEVTLWSINNDEVEELKKEREHKKIGRASCRERVCQYV